MNDLVSLKWRSVRIFTNNFGDNWYFEFLITFAHAFAREFPETQFFFTKYGLQRGKDEGKVDLDDRGFRHSSGIHRSLRFRFVALSREEEYLTEILAATPNKFFAEAFEPYDPLEFAEPRVYADYKPEQPRTADRIVRANLVGQMLCCNARFVLHALAEENGKCIFEKNKRLGLGTDFQTSFWYPLHMLRNAYGMSDGQRLAGYLARRPLTKDECDSISKLPLVCF